MEENFKTFEAVDEKGNHFKLCFEAQVKYPTRYDLKFYFNNKMFKLQHFGTLRDALNVYDLLTMIPTGKKES